MLHALNPLSRLKGIETILIVVRDPYILLPLNTLSRLKGIETISSNGLLSLDSSSESTFPFEGN